MWGNILDKCLQEMDVDNSTTFYWTYWSRVSRWFTAVVMGHFCLLVLTFQFFPMIQWSFVFLIFPTALVWNKFLLPHTVQEKPWPVLYYIHVFTMYSTITSKLLLLLWSLVIIPGKFLGSQAFCARAKTGWRSAGIQVCYFWWSVRGLRWSTLAVSRRFFNT